MDHDESGGTDRCPACGSEIPPEAERCPSCKLSLIEAAERDDREARHRQGEDTFDDAIQLLDEEAPLPRQPEVEFQDLTTVFEGSISEVMAVKASLGARGYETYTQDDQTKVMDPFITGGNAFLVTLKAPTDTAPEILEILREVRERTRDDRPRTPEEKERDEVEKIGRRIILSAMFFFTAPIGFFFGFPYFVRFVRMTKRPSDWGWVIFWWLVTVVELVLLFGLYLAITE
jgi:hypothetical protein